MTAPDAILEECLPLDVNTALRQIGAGTVLSVSGGRWTATPSADGWWGLTLPCGSGYRVDVFLHATDTYVVRRVFARGGREWVKGEARDVYAEELSETVYRAGMFRDDWTPGA